MVSIVDAQAELWRYRLAQPVGGSGVASVDVLIVTLYDADGRSGLGFSYVLGGCDKLPLEAARLLLERFVTGRTPAHPEVRWRQIAASFNRTGGGPYGNEVHSSSCATTESETCNCLHAEGKRGRTSGVYEGRNALLFT